MGDVVMGIVLEEKGLLPDFEMTPAPVLVTVFDEQRFPDSLTLASELRRTGLNVACYPEAVKLPRQFKYADRIGARVVLVLGPEETESGRVTVKNLRNGEQAAVPREAVESAVRRILETRSG
jgi:histidyl-tRNA synthetase